jgi:hypothetical protein
MPQVSILSPGFYPIEKIKKELSFRVERSGIEEPAFSQPNKTRVPHPSRFLRRVGESEYAHPEIPVLARSMVRI